MQETGKINAACDKILSIQLQLGGLSFYYGIDRKYSFRQLKERGEVANEIKYELAGCRYNVVKFYHNSTDYIVIPLTLFDENMCEAYLQTKGIKVDNNSTIVTSRVEEYMYVSLIDKSIYDCLKENFDVIYVLPLIAKVISYGASYDFDMVSFIISDSFLHIAYYENKILKLCESLPIKSDSDIDFFTGSIIKKYKPSKTFKVILLYETGKYSLSMGVASKYKVIRVTKDNYFAI